MCYTDKQIDNRVKKLNSITEQIAELEKQADAIRAELKNDLEGAGQEERQTENFIVRWKKIISSRIDSTALKAALPDVYKTYTKQIETRRFTIA